jgi:3-hydroxybutyrate dehydrogenase
MTELKGRSALVTGSNGGIGYAIAAALAEQGCNIALNGPGPPEAMERLRSGLAAKGVSCIYSPADVGKPVEVEQMVRDATARLGAVDILVNNAVTRHFHPVDEFPVEEWEAALAVNLSAAFHTIRLALPGMKRRNWGRIVNMASIYSTRGCENRVDYVTTKHAIIGLTRTVALEVARTGITCNALQPGWVLTPHSERQIADHMEKCGTSREEAIAALLESRQPTRRFITREEVAAFVVFLCSETASNITGAVLSVDGGWSAVP